MAEIYISDNKRDKKNKMRRFWIILIALACVVAFSIAAIVISSFVKASSIMEKEGSELSPFAANLLPDYSNVSFQTLDGQLTLRGWWLRSQTEETRATVLLVHSQEMNRLPFGLESVNLFDQLTLAGCNVLTFDLRCIAEADGSMSSFGYMEADDVLAALAYVEALDPEHPIILYGIGSGTTAAFRAMSYLDEIYADENKKADAIDLGLPHPLRISGLILDTPARSSDDFIAAVMALEDSLGRFFFPRTVPLAIRLSAGNKEKQDYLQYLSQLTIPVLLLGHEHDSLLAESAYLPLWVERERIHPTLTQSFKAKGSGHITAFASDSNNYSKAVQDFINDWY